MNLPSFLWLWRIAAWAMGFALLLYAVQGLSGFRLFTHRIERPATLRRWHQRGGWLLVGAVLLLFSIGIIGTLGRFGSLGHSPHLVIGSGVTGLVLLSAWSTTQINPQRPWARRLHLACNGILGVGLIGVLLTGWQVVQKYLP